MRAALLAGAARAAAGAPPPPVQDCGPVLRDFKFGVTLDENDQVVADVATLEEVRVRYAAYQWCLYFDPQKGTKAYAASLTSEGSPEPTLLFATPKLPELKGGTYALPAFDSMISVHIKLHGTFDPTEEFFLVGAVRKGDTVIEVGANIGVYTRVLGQAVGADGVVHAIEPFRRTFQFLTANVVLAGLHNVHTHCFGAGNRSGRIQVRAPHFTHPPSNLGASSLRFKDDVPSTSEFVTIAPLDRRLRHVDRLNVLKIDVEDMEGEVLQGAQELLQRFAPLLWMEHKDFQGCYQKCPLIQWLGQRFDYVCETPAIVNMEKQDIVICISKRAPRAILGLGR